MPRTEEQNEKIKNERKQQILNAAMLLFSKQNPAEVSIAKIAKEAGVSKGLMYSYYESKEHLQKEIVFQCMDEIMSIFQMDKGAFVDAQDFRERIDRLFDHVQNNITTWSIYTQLLMQPSMKEVFMSPKVLEMMEDYQRQLYQYMTNQGFEDPEKEIVIMGALIDGISVQYVSAPEFIDLNVVRNHIKDVYGKEN
ncbi:TetR/AcrR family transcriptional regulator [Halosquirtibacter laminarini]|uniref:TetR/AcrR family transcriptional regulator n=1 Tax=Halosquirtibacter laminarini TaxID=3374600 RepID=A0AC61NHN7_9BACT|nr:TetR/AcrR family transcriptional regulator [Prolixibacteraceae bacterium]